MFDTFVLAVNPTLVFTQPSIIVMQPFKLIESELVQCMYHSIAKRIDYVIIMNMYNVSGTPSKVWYPNKKILVKV